jgi:hypothetical protein
MKQAKLFFWMTTIILLSAIVAFADVKIRTRSTVGGQATENTVYIKGKRQRSEQDFGGLKTVTLTQCDMRRDVQLNERAKTYFISLYESGGLSGQTGETPIENSQSKIQNQKGGVVTTTVTLKDTGERKQMFGYTARHILTTIVTESSPDACSPVKTKMETDGWYIDAEFVLDCLIDRQYKPEISSRGGGCQDRQVFKQNGSGKLGYPVYLKTTMRGENGGEDFVSIQEVLEISPAALDASLFEIPAGFREVKNRAEIFTGGMTDMNDDEQPDDEDEKPGKSSIDIKPQVKTSAAQTVKNAAPDSETLPSTLGAKNSGVIRLGVAAVKTLSVGEGMNAGELSAAVKNTLAEYLKGANVELVQIEAKLPSAIDEEAKQKSCDFVIFVTVSHKKGGGFGKFLGKVAPVIADNVPGSTGSVAGNEAVYAGKQAVYTAGEMAGNVRAKDELTLEINLQSTAGAVTVLTKQFKAKAKSDGDDIISPLIEQAAAAILQAALNGRS